MKVNIEMEKSWNGKGYDIKGNSINELKNGQGYVKEYEYEKLVFEDEYLNGERNGKGKEHHQFGGLLFEDEYLNWKRHGKGKEFDYFSGQLKFEGQYIYGYRIRGKEYFNDTNNEQKSKYEYDFLNEQNWYQKAKEYGWNSLIYGNKFFNKNNYNIKTNIIIFEGECLNYLRLKGK